MRSRREIYQAKMEACRHQAELAQDDIQKDRWTRLAEQWSKMADETRQAAARPVTPMRRSRARLNGSLGQSAHPSPG